MAEMHPSNQSSIPTGETNKSTSSGKGWHGNSEGHAQAGRKGGRAAHELGRAHRFSSEEAREAGRKGGRVAHERGKAHEFTSEEARDAGRKGTRKSA